MAGTSPPKVPPGYAKDDALSMLLTGIAAVQATFFTNPVDVARCRLQMQNELVRGGGKRVYSGPFDCVMKAWRSEGARGVQRGLGPAMIREFPKSGFRVGAYEPVLKALHTDKGPPPMWKRFVAGVASSGVSAFLCNPLDLMKTRIQASGGLGNVHHEVDGAVSAIRGIVRQGGTRGLWSGTGVNVLRSVSYSSVMLPVNDYLKQVTHERGMRDGVLRDAACSLAGAAVGILFLNPVDVMRTRIYNQPVDAAGKGKLYDGIASGALKIARTEGPLAFYKGTSAGFMKTGPQCTLIFIFLGYMRRSCRGWKQRQLDAEWESEQSEEVAGGAISALQA